MKIKELLQFQTGKRLDGHIEAASGHGDNPGLVSRVEDAQFELVFHVRIGPNIAGWPTRRDEIQKSGANWRTYSAPGFRG